MSTRKREQLELIFDKINVKAHEKGATLTSDVPVFSKDLKKLKQVILDEEAPKTIAARDFDMQMAITTFGLRFVDYDPAYLWKIEEIPDIRFSPTSSLAPILAKYGRTVDRSSEAACKTPVDLILIECVAELQGQKETPSDDRPGTPSPHRNIKICFEVSFFHQLSPKPTGQAATAVGHAATINGRVDYGIGIITPSPKFPNRRFHALLIAVEAKAKNSLDSAFPQLVVYLACLHQARKARERTDCSVYGFTSDGYEFCFVTITHEGVVKHSRRFNIWWGDMEMVMGCIMYILRKSLERSPTVMPDKKNDGSDVEIDDQLVMKQ